MGARDDGDEGDFEAETVEVEIGDAIDLHTFAPRDVPGVVAA